MEEKRYLTVALIAVVITIVYACLSAQDTSVQSYDEPTYLAENEIEETEDVDEPEDIEEETKESEDVKEVKSEEFEVDAEEEVEETEDVDEPEDIEEETKESEDVKEVKSEEFEVDAEEEVEEDAEEAEEKREESESISKETGPTGIIAFYTYSQSRDGKFGWEIPVVSINPNTGTTQEISHFRIEGVIEESDEYYIAWSAGKPFLSDYGYIDFHNPDITANLRNSFSQDFSKLATIKIYTGNKEKHVGWIDSNSDFFDLTVSLGEEPKSDFDDPRNFWVMGFTPDGTFEYGETEKGNSNHDKTYYVTPDNMKQSFEGEPFISTYLYSCNRRSEGYEAVEWFMGENLLVSDWIDETRCIADNRDTSFIVNTATQEITEYIPGDSRKNWSGVTSPDGSQIAFLSMSAKGTEVPNIYVTSVNGGNPRQIKCDLEMRRPDSGSNYGIFLLDWR